MTRTGKLLWAALALALVLLLVWPLLRRVRRELTLEPVAAWVGIERAGSGIAEVGFRELPAEQPFTLHAILEARRGDRRLFFTEAARVRIAGEEFGGPEVRPWHGDLEARLLWFTVEGRSPVVRAGEDPPQLRYQANFRGDWPHAWSIPGRLEPYRRRLMAADRELEGRFGTQRYQVRIELFGPDSEIRPKDRVTSAGPDELLSAPGEFPGAAVALPGRLGPASRVFGLPQVIGPLDDEAAALVRRWQDDGLAFSLPLLLRDMAAVAGRRWEQLEWSAIDLAAGPAWGEGAVAPGDLVRVGGRIVVLYRDEGGNGALDGGDLCFDFFEGATVERLEDVFTGEGLVEWAGWSGGLE